MGIKYEKVMLIRGITALFLLLLFLTGVIAILASIILSSLVLYRVFVKESWKLLLTSAFLFGGGFLVIFFNFTYITDSCIGRIRRRRIVFDTNWPILNSKLRNVEINTLGKALNTCTSSKHNRGKL